MNLFAILAPMAASMQPATAPELSKALATLDDWRSILIYSYAISGVLVALVCALVAVIVRLATRRSANDQATLAALQANTAASTELASSVRALEFIAAYRASDRST